MFGGQFVIRYLELARRNPRFHLVAVLLVRAFAVCAVLALLLPESIILPLTQPLGLVSCVMVMWTGIYQWRQGSQWARSLVIAWSVLMVGTSAFILMLLDYLPRTPVTEYLQIVGFVVETTMLSIALAGRVSQDRVAQKLALQTALDLAHQVNLANQQNLLLQRQINDDLEHKVDRQTWQLQATLDKLFEANERLEKMALTDSLTGLYNRRYFDTHFAGTWRQARQAKTPLALLMIDIDHFKSINDRFGHQVGDQCLETVARVLESLCQRPDDQLIRYGGEEFVMVLPGTEAAAAQRMAERVRQRIEATDFLLQGKRVPVTISVGFASAQPEPGATTAGLFADADRALYAAKHAGRNCVKGVSAIS
jgi:diguanylate cyclase